MHILHLTPYYAPAYAFGGVVRAVEGMAQALHQRNHQITILTTDALNQHARLPAADAELRAGVRVVRVRNASVWLRGRWNLSTPLGMGQALAGLLPTVDVLHVHEFRTLENVLALPQVPPRLPVILSPHGTLTQTTGRSTFKRLWDRGLSPRLARRIQHILCLTEQEQTDAQALWAQWGLTPTCRIVPNGVNLAEFATLPPPQTFRQPWGIAADETVILFLGRLHPRKGVIPLTQAFRALNLPQVKLVLAGPDEGSLAQLAPLLNEQIVVTGYLDNAARLAALSAADVFALPAIGEGLSMAALEALAAGVPLLLAPGCHLPIVATVGAGLIVEPEVEALTAALQQLVTQPAQRGAMRVAARTLAQTRYSWAAIAAELEAVYHDIQ
jgi:glycosyltransferase involved in cell wall biosynthesis